MFRWMFTHLLTALIGVAAIAYAYVNSATYFVA